MSLFSTLLEPNIWLDSADLKTLAVLAKKQRIKTAQLSRLAIAEYLKRNR